MGERERGTTQDVGRIRRVSWRERASERARVWGVSGRERLVPQQLDFAQIRFTPAAQTLPRHNPCVWMRTRARARVCVCACVCVCGCVRAGGCACVSARAWCTCFGACLRVCVGSLCLRVGARALFCASAHFCACVHVCASVRVRVLARLCSCACVRVRASLSVRAT